jgi:DNA primase
LGYAPGGNRLFGAARQQGIDPKILERAGLVELREGGYHDRFWDRISFPIFSSSGRVIGFGGRVLDDSRTPKYLNSPETELFKKGENLYGLYQTQDGIRRNGGLMVEGYFDLLSMYTHGFENVVAPLGTALTLAQARLLRRFSPQVTIVFDADRAGIAAAHRALEVLLEANLDPKVALLEAGTDPDSFLKAAGRDELSRRIAEAQDFVDFCYHYRRPLGVGEESDLIQELLGYTSRVSDEVKRELYLKRIAERSGVSFEVLARRLQRPGSTRPLKPRRLLTFEEKIVASVVAEPGLLEAARAELSLDEIEDEGLRKILEVNYESGAISVADLLNHLPSELGERLTGLLARLVDRIRSPDELLTKIQEFKSRKQGKEHLKRLGMEKDEDRRITFLAQILKRAKIRLGSSRTRRE